MTEVQELKGIPCSEPNKEEVKKVCYCEGGNECAYRYSSKGCSKYEDKEKKCSDENIKKHVKDMIDNNKNCIKGIYFQINMYKKSIMEKYEEMEYSLIQLKVYEDSLKKIEEEEVLNSVPLSTPELVRS